ncbi:MAG: hypothetical protein V9G10_05885 [Candidatus Nanopelagicales bacterium]
MPSVLFDNIGELLTNAGDPLSDAAMVVDGDLVAWTGPAAAAPDCDERVDCGGAARAAWVRGQPRAPHVRR